VNQLKKNSANGTEQIIEFYFFRINLGAMRDNREKIVES